jgi:hypothetical protein
MLGNSSVAGRLAASQEGLSSMELDSSTTRMKDKIKRLGLAFIGQRRGK